MTKSTFANESVSGLTSQAAFDDLASRANNFNFLRLLLATLVILSHSPEIVDGNRNREILTQIFHTVSFGELAVDDFFILSGYLIMQSWQRDPRLFDFFKKRILRIYPGFIVASLISAFVFGPLGAQPHEYFSKFSYFSFFQDMSLLRVPNVPAAFCWDFICYSQRSSMDYSI
jgi:peptidoglycan/LPS O-acetylase OafA/YrhL